MSLEQLELDLGKAGYRLDKSTGAVVDGSGNIMADLTNKVRNYLGQLRGSKAGKQATKAVKDAGAGLIQQVATPAGRNLLVQRGGLLGGALATGGTILRDVQRDNPIAAGGALVGGAAGVGTGTLLSKLAPQRGLLGAAIKVAAPIVGGVIGSQTGSNVTSRMKGAITQEPDNQVPVTPGVQEGITDRANTFATDQMLKQLIAMRPELIRNAREMGQVELELQRQLTGFKDTKDMMKTQLLQQQALDASRIRNQAGLGILSNAAKLGINAANNRALIAQTLISNNPYAPGGGYAPNISFT
jgi:hypothetical protein